MRTPRQDPAPEITRTNRRGLLLFAGGLGLAAGCSGQNPTELTQQAVESLDTDTLENGKLVLRGFALVSYMVGTRVVFLPTPAVRILGVALIFSSVATKLAIEYLDDELTRRHHTVEVSGDEVKAIETSAEVRFQTEHGETETVRLGPNQYVTTH